MLSYVVALDMGHMQTTQAVEVSLGHLFIETVERKIRQDGAQ